MERLEHVPLWHRPEFSRWLVTALFMMLTAMIACAVATAVHHTGVAIENELNQAPDAAPRP